MVGRTLSSHPPLHTKYHSLWGRVCAIAPPEIEAGGWGGKVTSDRSTCLGTKVRHQRELVSPYRTEEFRVCGSHGGHNAQLPYF